MSVNDTRARLKAQAEREARYPELLARAEKMLLRGGFYAGYYLGHAKDERGREWIEQADLLASEIVQALRPQDADAPRPEGVPRPVGPVGG